MQLLSGKPYFVKMGDLHTEMAFLSSIGDWMEGSGWTDVYGRVDSFFRGSKVKRTRYAYQISLKVLLQLSKEAFDNCSSCEHNEWVNERKAASTSAYYWFTAVEMIVTLSIFVRSIRESNFINYANILKVMMPCVLH